MTQAEISRLCIYESILNVYRHQGIAEVHDIGCGRALQALF